ncbi:unnamed protein product [Somion occarium]|uniref:Uncharacterized protein n=1 Tax=Somion occarium TaxID=3059160 RepID=A0ABP1DZK4_9APHY
MSTRHSFLSTTGLIRSPSAVSTISTHASSGGTKPTKSEASVFKTKATRTEPLKALRTRAGIVPLGPTFLVVMALLFSLLFIASISFAFIGSEEGPDFKDVLDDVAQNNPGIVLVGENVDVDVDEPSITVRWSILGCGSAFVLKGSEGAHGSSSCGIPSMPLSIFVDANGENPTATYDPTNIPFLSKNGKRQSIQNLFQFDSDHVLDVHLTRLYPFDTYELTSTIHILDSNKNPVTLSRLPTITETPSFLVSPSDVASFMNSTSSDDATEQQGRNLVLKVVRPGEARAFALLLFAVNWMLAHATVAYTVLAWKTDDTERILKYLAFVAATMLLIPQLRNAMPDAPGFDGVLIGMCYLQLLLTHQHLTLTTNYNRQHRVLPTNAHERLLSHLHPRCNSSARAPHLRRCRGVC